MMELKAWKANKKRDKLADWFRPRSTELNQGNILYTNKVENIYDECFAKEKYYIWDYNEIILSPRRHSSCLQRDSLPD